MEAWWELIKLVWKKERERANFESKREVDGDDVENEIDHPGTQPEG